MSKRTKFVPGTETIGLEERKLLSTVPSFCTPTNPGYSTQLWAQMQAVCRQYANQPSPQPQSPGNPTQPPTTQGPSIQQQEAQIALNSAQNALNFMNRYGAGRNGGWYVYYAYPPVYQGQTQYTPAARPYFVTPATAVRVLQQFVNNNYQVTNVVRY